MRKNTKTALHILTLIELAALITLAALILAGRIDAALWTALVCAVFHMARWIGEDIRDGKLKAVCVWRWGR